MLYFEERLKYGETSPSNERAIWKLVRVHNNDIINRSCILEFAYSGFVIDVPGATDNPETTVVQWTCNHRVNQRWNIIKYNKHYMI